MVEFSVVIATYNRREYVLETIRSAAEQTYAPKEIIVVVDGDRDGTATAIRHRYPSVIVHEQKNYGRSVARNTGIALASGEWVCFIDDDDLWHREKLQVTAKYIEAHPDCRAITNPVWFFCDDENGPASGFGFKRDFAARNLEGCHQAVKDRDPSDNSYDYLKINGNSFRLLLERNRGVMSASVVERRTLIRAGCFSPMQSYGDDWTMFVNVARLCEWHTLPKRLGFTRLHPAQSSGEVYNGLVTLTGIVAAWYSGRPFPDQTQSLEMLKELVKYAPAYRQAVQDCHWTAIKRGQFRLAKLIRSAGRMLLPRMSDRIYTLLPPPITWRWDHYVRGTNR